MQEQILSVFSKTTAEDIVIQVTQLESCRWFHRQRIHSIPTRSDDTEASYGFLGVHQIPVGLRQYLSSLAPEIEGLALEEVCINRYQPGDWMPQHIDQCMYAANLVVFLSDNGDGLWIEDEFIQDNPGMGVLFPARSRPHEVKPVKHLRYVLIYLYGIA